ncbi:MAG: c-type cytochrome biogenesis protein CcmI [Thiotrichaceae bacterium]|nr:c-type cytochrome biogenesis protein CcmI [Thiotrichaceae bacterium]PCI12445.1 MAG: c-type cytochrome biogenesis protein CcmI [Thiotrichales bacterium]
MIIFWIVAALLTLAALLFLLPPLLQLGKKDSEFVVEQDALNVSIYKDQMIELENDLLNDIITKDQCAQGQLELEQRLLEDVALPSVDEKQSAAGANKVTAAIVSLVVVALTVPLYLQLGKVELVVPMAQAISIPQAATEMNQEEMTDQVSMMVSQLSARLEKDPSDVQGWAMLGRSYYALNRYGDAVAAFSKAVSIVDNDAQLLTDYADAMAMSSGEQTLEGRPMQLIMRALNLDPQNQKALWLAGTAAYERADFESALIYWKRIYAMLDPNSQTAQTMAGNIAETERLMQSQRANSGASSTAGIAASASATVPAGSVVSGVVTLSQSLAADVLPTDTIYIFARAMQGPRMPLAILKTEASKMPIEFILDDSMAMDASMNLSSTSTVMVMARISRSGNATPQSGDMQGGVQNVKIGTSGIEIVIDEVIP